MSPRRFATHTGKCVTARKERALRLLSVRVKLTPVTELLDQNVLPAQEITAVGIAVVFTTPFEARMRGRTLPAATEMGLVAWGSKPRQAVVRFNAQQLAFLKKSFDTVPKISETVALVNMKQFFTSKNPEEAYYKGFVLRVNQIKGWFGTEKRRRAHVHSPISAGTLVCSP